MNPARDYKELATLAHKIHDLTERLADISRKLIKATDPHGPCGVDASPEEYRELVDECEWVQVQLESVINKFKGLSRASTKELLEGESERNGTVYSTKDFEGMGGV